MEYLVLIFFLALATKFLLGSRKQRKNLPPSPFALPIIGHLHLLKQPVHRAFHKLSQKYGPVMSLKLGSQLAIIVSSPSAAEECFTKNDIIFANRPDSVVSNYLQYNRTTIASTDYSDHWRKLRRISYLEFFSPTCLKYFSDIRRDEVRVLLRRLSGISSHGFAKVTLIPMFMDLTSNIVMRVVAGKRYYGDDVSANSEEARVFREIVEETFEMCSTTHPSDLFPILRMVDYDGFLKKLASVGKKADVILQKLVDEHRINKGGNSMISHLVSLQETQPEYYTDEVIKGLILILLLGGTETTAVTLEWAMTNLLNHPEVLAKAKQELDSQIGRDRLIDETDLSKLHYLQSIIFENLRFCPIAPVLLPHFSSEDCTIGGYHVPRRSMLFVNVWAIQRDPELWEDPSSFNPERFDNGKFEEYKNKMFPFGKGRRICPGEDHANRVMGLVLSSLLQCFEWERVGESKIDMTEKVVLSMTKVEPLEVMCRARPNLQKFLRN